MINCLFICIYYPVFLFHRNGSFYLDDSHHAYSECFMINSLYLYIWKSRVIFIFLLDIFNSNFDLTNSTLKMCEKLASGRIRTRNLRRRMLILVTSILTIRPQRLLVLLQRQITNIHTLSFLSTRIDTRLRGYGGRGFESRQWPNFHTFSKYYLLNQIWN